LVVIAIIAILAAILFPVFAQAKEAAKKTAALSNCKQMATSIAVYITDNDDTYPLASSIVSGTAAGYNCVGSSKKPGYVLLNQTYPWAATTPAGADSPDCGEHDKTQVLNASEPYRKNWELTTQPGIQQLDGYAATYFATFVGKPAVTGFTYNGLLHALPGTEVANVSFCPMFWPGQGKYNIRGYNFTNPTLTCEVNTAPVPPCRFQASSVPQAGSTGTPTTLGTRGDSFWQYTTLNNTNYMYSQGYTQSRVDTSAKFLKVASGGKGLPGRLYDANGVLTASFRCTTGTPSATAQIYLACFRPDTTPNYVVPGVSAAPNCGF